MLLHSVLSNDKQGPATPRVSAALWSCRVYLLTLERELGQLVLSTRDRQGS